MFHLIQGSTSIISIKSKTSLHLFLAKSNRLKIIKRTRDRLSSDSNQWKYKQSEKYFCFHWSQRDLLIIFRYSSLNYFIQIDLFDPLSFFDNLFIFERIIKSKTGISQQYYHWNIGYLVFIFSSDIVIIITYWSFKKIQLLFSQINQCNWNNIVDVFSFNRSHRWDEISDQLSSFENLFQGHIEGYYRLCCSSSMTFNTSFHCFPWSMSNNNCLTHRYSFN